MLDEATAAAEAMTMCHRIVNRETDHETNGFFVAEDCHPQTIAVLQTRAEPLGIILHIGRAEDADVRGQELFGPAAAIPGDRRLGSRLQQDG